MRGGLSWGLGRLCSPRPTPPCPRPPLDSAATHPVQLGSRSMRACELRPRLRPLTRFCPGLRGAAGHQARGQEEGAGGG